jgi:hypothetical protein
MNGESQRLVITEQPVEFWEIIGWSSRLQGNLPIDFRRIYRECLKSTKNEYSLEDHNMCNRLDLATLGFWPVIDYNSHWTLLTWLCAGMS